MFIAMNRFRIAEGREVEFETRWKARESRLLQQTGFLGFHLLRDATRGDHTLYATHTVWANRAAFETWTRSDDFVASHRGAESFAALMTGPSEFEGFDAVFTIAAPDVG
ncbi:antibiotic biosynthesis monooxygenase family protein [Pinisolibacter sp.]|uniref:antibiotic biosynthesis monooxygenase family protein n=1 Tax=Pinisolibacter sp. TaxID=2172024 RepID=UPI002FDEA364